jgi:large subunit ribosomal protein L35
MMAGAEWRQYQAARGSDVAKGMPDRSFLLFLQEKKMPKMKTKSGAKKRFKFLGNGKVKRTHSHLRHILTKKTTKQKRNLRGTAIISATDVKRVRAMMPTQ